ncbi:MAG: hypothetical protein IKT41_03695 [Clostridia bacterium]|nr:hypothetical protein [Clostridia bacterium]
MYGLIEIIKIIINIFTKINIKSNGVYMILALKNQEEKAEGIIRSFLFRYIYGKDDILENIIIADLDSVDNTKEVLKKLKTDYEQIEICDWEECKEIIDKIK